MGYYEKEKRNEIGLVRNQNFSTFRLEKTVHNVRILGKGSEVSGLGGSDVCRSELTK